MKPTTPIRRFDAAVRRTLPSLPFVFALGCDVPQVPDAPATSGSGAGAAQSADDAEPAADRFASITQTPLPDPGDVAPVTDEPREFTAKDPVKGRRSRAAGGYLGAVGATRFYAEHQMIINNINYALKLFEASEGRYPRSHEEFMEKIIRANNIQLPELVEGEEYIYVPEEPDKGIQIRQAPDAAGAESAGPSEAP